MENKTAEAVRKAEAASKFFSHSVTNQNFDPFVAECRALCDLLAERPGDRSGGQALGDLVSAVEASEAFTATNSHPAYPDPEYDIYTAAGERCWSAFRELRRVLGLSSAEHS